MAGPLDAGAPPGRPPGGVSSLDMIGLDRSQKLYLYLSTLFVSALLVADITGGKLFRAGAN